MSAAEVDQRTEYLQALVRDMSRDPDPASVTRRFRLAMRETFQGAAILFLSVRDQSAGKYVITRFQRPDGTCPNDCDDLWCGPPEPVASEGGFLGEQIGAGQARLLPRIDVGDDPVLGDALEPYRSLMLLPIYREGAIANWVAILHPEEGHYTDRNFENTLLRVNVLAALVENKSLTRDLERASAWIQDEIDQIAQVQRSLLPSCPPAVPGLDIACRWETFDRAGGDYYDFLRWKGPEGAPERWTWVLADASGHGPASAVMVAMLHMLLRTLPEALPSPARLLSLMNEKLFACPTCNHFMTALAASYEPDTRELRLAVAGHPPPLLRSPDGTVRALPVDPAVPLGIVGEVEAPTASTCLEPGSVLLLYTDGLVEAQDVAQEVLGVDRLSDVLAEAPGDAEAILEALFEAVGKHEAGRRPSDDQTAVVVRVLGPETRPPADLARILEEERDR
ncbi:MAG: PP2C family protein-serine/threonine phosphatase [Planctomycetota bacterium]